MESSDDRTLRLDRYLRALAALEEVLQDTPSVPASILRDSRIQRFAFTFETLWKFLRVAAEHAGVEADKPPISQRNLWEKAVSRRGTSQAKKIPACAGIFSGPGTWGGSRGPPQSVQRVGPSRSPRIAAPQPSSRAVGLPLEVIPERPGASLVQRSHLVVSTTSWSSVVRTTRPRSRIAGSDSLGLSPRSRVSPEPPPRLVQAGMNPARASTPLGASRNGGLDPKAEPQTDSYRVPLSRGFSPLQRDSSRRQPPTPRLPHAGLVAPSRFLGASTRSSASDLAGLFQPAALMGFSPSALPSPRIASASRRRIPSRDFDETPRRRSVYRLRGFLSATHPTARRLGFPAVRRSSAPGFLPPGGPPLPCLGPRRRLDGRPLARLPGCASRHTRFRGTRPSSQALQAGPRFRVPDPVLQSVKEHGNWLVSCETAGPSEVLVLVPSSRRAGARVSDRLTIPDGPKANCETTSTENPCQYPRNEVSRTI